MLLALQVGRLDAFQIGDAVNVPVVAAECLGIDGETNSGMEGVAGHQPMIPIEQFAGKVEDLSGDGQHRRNNPPRQIVNLLPLFPSAKGPVAMEDLCSVSASTAASILVRAIRSRQRTLGSLHGWEAPAAYMKTLESIRITEADPSARARTAASSARPLRPATRGD